MKVFNLRHLAKFLFGLIAILYPLFVFCTLVIFKLPIKYFSISIIVFAIAYSIFNSRHNKEKRTIALFISPIILCAIGTVSLFLDDNLVLKWYPPLADFAFLTIMVTSFFFPPPIAFYFIDIFDKTMKIVIPKHRFEVYCFRATIAWCIYFVVDGIIAILTLTIYVDSESVWYIYNAGITYVIMGIIFAGEYIILKRKLKKYTLKKAMENTDASAPVEGSNGNS